MQDDYLGSKNRPRHLVQCHTHQIQGGGVKFGMRQVTSNERWIYCYDPKTKVYEDELKPTKVACERSGSKQMIASFFNKIGHMTTVALENCRTVNSNWCTTICLPEVVDELRKNYRKRHIILHHNNASSQTAKQAINFWRRKM
ncbi:hypothetical protein EVAR_37678_1 [Eumeta japonica]|uniref:Mariner Mos1 transposase n=1 Tax=Eumeta variegata TaxID=151549 RepID=A0A4C1Z0J5_EUMVA|nr:hypothetical protein EVAR_37678_1 [Eumeta japonica]